MTRSVDVRITGRVQGVSFRAYAAEQAQRLGLAGWVRNEPDGSVSAHVEGSDDEVQRMLAWLHHGSPGARVENVTVTDATSSGAPGFEVA